MKIKSLQLENIRSHVKSVINFTDGFNCLVGGLGTGKSSVLYALDFALFGEPLGRSYDYLLREGEDRARVTLKFSANGKEYAIIRALKRSGNRISQDMDYLRFFEDGELVAELKSDAVSEQLFSVIGIDKELFRRLIWVRQEHLKDILNMAPGERQKNLDQLFGLSDYETAWSNLRSIIRWYESERNSLESDPDVARIGELKTRYNEAVSDLTKKEAELKEANLKLSEIEKKLKEVTSRLQALENVRRRNEELRRREAEVKARISAAEKALQIKKTGIDEQRRRIEELHRLLRSLRDQENSYREKLGRIGLPKQLTIEQLKEHAETLQDQISTDLGREEVIRSEIKRATQRISSLAKENRCPLCLQDLSSEYKDNLIKRLYDEISENRRRLKDFEENVRRLEDMHATITEIISNLQVIKTRMENLSEQERAEQRALMDSQRQIEDIVKEIADLRKELVYLHSQIGEFDILKFEEIQKQRDIIFGEYASLKSRMQSIEAQILEISKRINDLKERVEQAESKISRLERVKKIIELLQEIRQSYRSIQPKLRNDFVFYLERTIQQILDELTGVDSPTIQIRLDENYTPIVEGASGYQRSVSNLSGGERTLLAFAYRLGVAQLLMQWRTGRGLQILLLDEPTESLGREDGSINRLAESLSRLKTIEQIIAVTHSEEFADKADHVIWLSKEDNQSIVSS